MVTFQEIIQSHKRIEKFIHRTAVLTNLSLNHLTEAQLFCKCENFQKTGAFKIRGATNVVQQLSDEELERGVATSSSGNHGAAVAMAVGRRSANVTVLSLIHI